MKKFFFLLFISFCLLFITDRTLGNLLELKYFNAKSGVTFKTNYAMNKTSEDVLVFGTSRANHHYNTKILADSLSLSVYNTGRDGHMIFYQTALLRSTLKRYKPKRIILDFPGTFEFRQKDYDRLSTLLPYYDTNPEIRDLLLLKSKNERLKISLSNLYRFNSKILTILSSSIEFDNKGIHEKESYTGFVPLFGEYNNAKELISVKESLPFSFKADQNKVDAFREFIDLCKKNDIPLTIINSPLFFKTPNDQSIQMVIEICLEENIEFLDFSTDKTFLGNKKLFKDRDHLNNIGAQYFTNKVSAHFK